MSKNKNVSIKFPDNFLLGVGSSAYQIEGGWNADGKSPSIWDQYFHEKEDKESNAQVSSNGDIACDSYHLLEEDIKNLVALKVNIYRFSISWSRVLPNGDSRCPSVKGVQYYQNLINKLAENNIQPLVTMYHSDLPNMLQKLGGWANPNIVDYFKDYATFLFDTFGDKVKLWTTINEPKLLGMGYSSSLFPPAIGDEFNGIGDCMVWRNFLLAHAAAYKVYTNSFRSYQRGQISIVLDTGGYLPLDPEDVEHQKAAEKARVFNIGVVIQPLINGEFPKPVLDAFEKTNKNENLKIQRLIPFTENEKKDLIGSYDFIGFNYYISVKVRPKTKEEIANATDLSSKDLDFKIIMQDEVDMDGAFKGFSELIDWFRITCNDPVLFVAENGYSEKRNEDASDKKIQYHYGILTEVYKSMMNGAKIIGYTVWSFMDSLEWVQGYDKSLYGVLAVDFTDEIKRPRSEKPSTEYFRQLFKTKTLPPIPQ